MNGATTKAERREYRKVLGDQAAELLATQRDLVAALKRENEALAVEFVKHRSIVIKDLEVLHGRIDGASKWCEKNEQALIAQSNQRIDDWVRTLKAIGEESTHRLKLADEQRSYVDGEDREIRGQVNSLDTQVSAMNKRLCAAELALEDEQGNQHTTTQRELDAFIDQPLLKRLWWALRGRSSTTAASPVRGVK